MDQAFADLGSGVFDIIHFAHGSELLFDGPGNQTLHLLHRHTGVLGHNYCFANRNGRVFQFRKVFKLIDAANDYPKHYQYDGSRIIQCKIGYTFHFSSTSWRVLCVRFQVSETQGLKPDVRNLSTAP